MKRISTNTKEHNYINNFEYTLIIKIFNFSNYAIKMRMKSNKKPL